MPIQIVRNDITKMQVDAIVNAANRSLLGGGGVDGAIHRAAGPELLAECQTLGGCEVGHAKLTGGYRLPCRYVIHTVGPRWQGGHHGERELLISCYRAALELAKQAGCETVAFPLISAGLYGYPKDEALRIAVDTVAAFLQQNEMTVYIVIFDRAAYEIGGKLFAAITAYIDDRYVEQNTPPEEHRRRREAMWCQMAAPAPMAAPSVNETAADAAENFAPILKMFAKSQKSSLDDLLRDLDAGFSETLLQLIDRTGKKDSEIYKKANIDRKLFSKIRNNPDYRPTKATVLAFALALELDLQETKDFLARAGYALSHSSKFDIIVEFFIQNKDYDVFRLNEVLFAFDQPLIGG